jgi:hypothetical protein
MLFVINRYTIKWNGEEHYQASDSHGDQCVVNMRTKSCSCRRWEITGIPCKHAVAAIWSMKAHGQGDGIPEYFVNPVYGTDRWKQVYNHKVYPINGMSMWPKSQVPTVISPPLYHKPVGRPKKARKRSRVEKEDAANEGKTTTCGKCNKKGHNRRSCKGQEEV